MTVTLTRMPAAVEPVSTRRGARWRLPIGLGLFGFLASFAGSWIPSFWGDEAASVMSAERTLPSLFGMLKNVDAVHGFYYLFLHFWIQAFGPSELSVRLPSAIAVGFVVAGTFVLGRMLFTRNVGIAAARICAVLPRTSYMGADARSYAFSTAIAVWITVLFLMLLRNKFSSTVSRRLAWLGYAVAVTIGIYLFLYLGLLLLVHGVFLDTARSYRHHQKYWLGAAALAVTLAIPILAIGYSQRGQIAFLAHAPNVRELVERIQTALRGRVAEIVFVDDSNDDTPTVIGQVAAEAEIPVRLIRRDQPVGGPSGAVLVGLAESTSDWCIVMDGDLQHPPEVIPVLLSSGIDQDPDIVVASRHVNGGSSEGLSGRLRHLVSASATVLVRAMFPTRLRNCTDPMTGFFAIRRCAVDLDSLRPRGFKILLGILAHNTITVIEEPFVFGHRHAGESNAVNKVKPQENDPAIW
ncbi:glycosyltransferase [Cryobacterium sp. TMT1-2-2]|uniref:glycosyltransferase n=1 Tax=Cryobacterium sp. TMT1-2-2 TaxID=1259233 RepID=UPI00141B65D8|nr:glycosyltransferase [Cryobacterium sp. TMT1-2-2]